MNITVTVIDGISGHPADGVEVTVTGRVAGEEIHRMDGLTDAQGNFTYSSGAEQSSNGQDYTVELDVDAYFASLGIVPGYKQVSVLVRVVSPRADYRIGTLITPFAHALWSAQ